MDVKEAYNHWATQYDTNQNKTRDLEAVSLRKTLPDIPFSNCLEVGCGTGKNTEWLISKAKSMLAIDLSDEMLAKAKSKIISPKVRFMQADISQEWNFAANQQFDLITFSLILEHIAHLDSIFEKMSHFASPQAYIYIGELHPFKQYMGTKAKFETEQGWQVVTCFNHNISDFTNAAKKYGFEIVSIDEFFDNDDRTTIPRILTLLLRKSDK